MLHSYKQSKSQGITIFFVCVVHFKVIEPTECAISSERKQPVAMAVWLIAAVFLLCVSEVISNCPPDSGNSHWSNVCLPYKLDFLYSITGIYLMYRGDCYPNGSFFYDDNIRPENLMCVLPDTNLTTGEWTQPDGQSINCTTNPLHCNVGTSPANLSLYIPIGQGLPVSADGIYKCCLPIHCSDPNTNIITANIFSKFIVH